MTTTTTQETGYVVYSLDPEPFPSETVHRYTDQDKKLATTICLFTIIASTVLICLFFLIGHSFGYILLIILLVLSVALIVVYCVRGPTILYGLRRPTTSVKIPNYALHIIPAPHLNQNNNNSLNATNSGYYVYPYPNIHPAPVYTECKTIK